MTYTLGVTHSVPVSLPGSLIASGPDSSSSHGAVGTSYASPLKLAWKQQAEATQPWPEASDSAPPESQKPKPSCGARGRVRVGSWSPHGLSTSGWKPSQEQQCGSWQSPAGFPQHCSHQGLVFFFFFLRCGLKTDLLRPGTQLEFLQDKRLEAEASLGAGWGGAC